MGPQIIGNILLVDDDVFLRTSVAALLGSAGFEVIGSVSTAAGAISLAENNQIDVALLDLDLGVGPTGLDIAKALRQRWPNIGIIFLTTFQDPRFASVFNVDLPKGARYLIKSEIEDFGQLISVLLQVKYRPAQDALHRNNKFEKLTDLQIEVWKEVSEGRSSIEIANRRGISEKAVEATIAKIYKFLNIQKNNDSNPRILLANNFKKLSGKI